MTPLEQINEEVEKLRDSRYCWRVGFIIACVLAVIGTASAIHNERKAAVYREAALEAAGKIPDPAVSDPLIEAIYATDEHD